MCSNVLEFVELILPTTIQFKAHFDAAKDHFFASFEINPQLHNISIIHREWFGFLAWGTKANMIEECTAATLNVFDVPFSLFVPELAMPTAHNLGFEAHWC